MPAIWIRFICIWCVDFFDCDVHPDPATGRLKLGPMAHYGPQPPWFRLGGLQSMAAKCSLQGGLLNCFSFFAGILGRVLVAEAQKSWNDSAWLNNVQLLSFSLPIWRIEFHWAWDWLALMELWAVWLLHSFNETWLHVGVIAICQGARLSLLKRHGT